MFKLRGTPRLTSNLTNRSVAVRVVVIVQWLAHPTNNQGDAGLIPTHGIYIDNFIESATYGFLLTSCKTLENERVSAAHE